LHRINTVLTVAHTRLGLRKAYKRFIDWYTDVALRYVLFLPLSMWFNVCDTKAAG